MSATSYNKKQYEKGDFTDLMIVQLVAHWQATHGLNVDGYCGPDTQHSLLSARQDPSPDPDSSEAGLVALDVAIAQIGKGEEGGNNSGPFVEMLKHKEYDGNTDDDGAWCASFVSWCFEQAYKELNSPMPFAYSEGAKRIYKNVGDAGGFPEDPAPGDVVCWDRGDPGSWQGHVGFVEKVENGILYTVEGNVGAFPAKVKRFMHDMKSDSRLEGYSRAPKIERLA